VPYLARVRHVVRSVTRLATVVALIGAVVIITSSPADALIDRSKGSFFVYDTPDCTGQGTASTVTPPFSIGGRNYPPNEPMSLFVTYQATGERFGPLTFVTDSNGAFCLLVNRALPPGEWKIDILQPGSGFTDSKVIIVGPDAPTTTTAPPTSAPSTLPPSTSTAPTSTVDPPPATTTPPPTTESAASTSTPSPEFPWDVLPVPPPSSLLPSTGPSGTPVLPGLALMLVVLGTIAFVLARRSKA
jgi:LPXTG-motif cell wall-anchored protein